MKKDLHLVGIGASGFGTLLAVLVAVIGGFTGAPRLVVTGGIIGASVLFILFLILMATRPKKTP